MTTVPQTPMIRLNRRKLRSMAHDSIKCAETINLVYVTDKQKGISRIKKGSEFVYLIDNREVKDEDTLSRINSLVLPPAWADVWICVFHNGHLQATGLDDNGRKQYRYHSLWNALRSETKFFHLYDFGKSLCAARKRLKADLGLPGLPQQKVLSAIVSLMEYTGIRIGSNIYEKLYGSFGLTTLKDQHVKIKGNELTFSFKGKKGVHQNFTLKSKRLARIVQQCRDIPGKELFQYYDEHGTRQAVDSGMVNDYIKEKCGNGFTAKDFRTWTGTLLALEVFISAGCCDNETDKKKKIIEAIDFAAKRLGNTRTVCRKYYVHPVVIDHYSNRTIEKYTTSESVSAGDSELSAEEQILMKMLEDVTVATIALPGNIST